MMRRLHPDFHMPGYVKDVACEFDGEKFARSLHEAEADSVVIFAKCAYGFAYWNNTVGKRHPGLGGKDFFGDAVEACKRYGIETMAYYFPLAEQELGEPDELKHVWKQRGKEGEYYWALCPNTDYTEKYILPQIREITKKYPISGWHVDGSIIKPGGCWCECCRNMMKDEGIDTEEPEEIAEFSRRSLNRLLRKMSEAIRSEREDILLSFNNLIKIGCRPQTKWTDIIDVEVNMAEVDKAHTGALRSSLYSRHVRTLGRKFAITSSCRARGVAAYGSLATAEQLKYIAGMALSLGGYCQFISEMLPEGTLEQPLLDRVKEAFSFIREREQWCIGAKSVRYAAILGATEPGTGESTIIQGAASGILGTVRLLNEYHIPFDVIDETAEFSDYKIIILPDDSIKSDGVPEKLKDYVNNGGRLLAAGSAALKKNGESGLGDVLGISYEGEGDELSYFILDSKISTGLPEMPRLVKGKWIKVKPANEAVILADIVRPRLADEKLRIGWGYPPEKEKSGWPGLVAHSYYSGKTLYSAAPVFTDYVNLPDEEQRKFLGNLIDFISPMDERPVAVSNLPPSAEVSLMQKEGAWVLHILRGGAIEPPELRNIDIVLRPNFTPSRVYVAPSQENIPFTMTGSEVRLNLQSLGSHIMLVLEQ